MKSIIVVLTLVLTAGSVLWFLNEPKSKIPETQDESIHDVSLSSQMVFVYDNIAVPIDTRKLDLSGRSLSGSLKAEVGQLTELRELNLSNNNFTGLPAEVGQLKKIEVLNLSNNPFTGLPYEIGNLSNLTLLDLRGTNYATADLEVIKKSLSNEAEVLVD